MNTIREIMSEKIAESYYTALSNKHISDIGQYLNSDITLVSPLAEVIGKEAVVESIKNFVRAFNSLTIRAKFGSGNQAMLALDIDLPLPIGTLSGASLLTCNNGLISKIELFYDGRPFEAKPNEIFSQQ